ncbi:MAG: MFS transporter [Phyllobacteriaceae bacterium]|nr:MFS transporter [Phyllobacteriaceae bacterium]
MRRSKSYDVAASLWSPLRNERFRSLWLANLVSNLGTWMQGMGAAWMMVQLSMSPQLVAWVQTAMTLPILLIVVPAGLVADHTDRRTFLFFTHFGMAVTALALGILATGGGMTPTLLLSGTFLLGCGTAMTMPAWQAAISTLVDPAEIHSAATLNGMSFNFARTIGQALAGWVAQIWAVGVIFWLNAVSFLGLVFVFWRWRFAANGGETRPLAPRRPQMLAGFHTILASVGFRALLLRTFLIFFGASCMWSLLPAFAGIQLRLDAPGVGLLMSAIGAGAVAGGGLLPSLNARIGIGRLTSLAAALLGVSLLSLTAEGRFGSIWFSMAATGVGWAFVVSSLNGTAQSMFPVEIRARAISIYLMAMYGGTTVGSWTWGVLSASHGMNFTFVVAGAMLLVSALFMNRWSIT